MKIMLINVSLRPESKLKIFPIGIAYIATAIKKAGFDFDLLDIDLNRYSDAEVDNFLKKQKYDVIAMGCIVTGYSIIKNLCARIRKFQENCCIVVGNSVATSIYKILLSKTEADVAVMGEGDITIVELLKTVYQGGDLSEVKGIAYKTGEEILINPPQPPIADISTLPHIDFSLFDIEKYIENSKEQVTEDETITDRNSIRALPVNSARGCIGRCTFCYHNFQNYKW